MKRFLTSVAILCLIMGSVATAEAADRRSEEVTLYFHGDHPLGEVDHVNNFNIDYNAMDPNPPSQGLPKSSMSPYWADQWPDCAGMYMTPVWLARLKGQVRGDIKLILHTISVPRQLDIRLWADVTSLQCAQYDTAPGIYPKPVASATVDLPAGQNRVELVMEDVRFRARFNLMIQVMPKDGPGIRILYDSPEYASSLTFMCEPARPEEHCAR